jgi:hypothetical protein
MARDMEKKRAYDRERMRRIRQSTAKRRRAKVTAWYKRQFGKGHSKPPPGVTLERHRYWCRFVLSLPYWGEEP